MRAIVQVGKLFHAEVVTDPRGTQVEREPRKHERRRAVALAILVSSCIGTLSCTRPPVPVVKHEVHPAASSGGTGFEPVSIVSAVTKVKNLLTGLPPTPEEVQAVETDQSALKGFVAQWMTSPAYRHIMQGFFTTAFQQDAWDYADLDLQLCTRFVFGPWRERIVENFQQSFARTALELIDEGRPFTETMTTRRFMMTTALMSAYATIDDIRVGDRVTCNVRKLDRDVTIESFARVSLEDSVDPKSPSFLTFYQPGVASCPGGRVVYPAGTEITDVAQLFFSYNLLRKGNDCAVARPPPEDWIVKEPDFADWQMISIREPRPGEDTTPLYDLPAMRKGHELVLSVPRVGFFSTPAFAAHWPTNVSNQHRVTMNQAVIVALGRPFDLTNDTQPHSFAALDQRHAPSETECYGCHQSLDPMRQYFAQAYSQSFGRQEDPAQVDLPGEFAFHGVTATGTGIADLGKQLAGHPMFALAWVQKLCSWATSGACEESDPELQRLAGLFRSSGYSWNVLVRELFSSPLVTNLAETKTADATGEAVSIPRQRHLCATLSARLGTADVCSLDARRIPSDGEPPPEDTGFARVRRAVCAALSARLGVDDWCGLGRDRWSPTERERFADIRRLVLSWPSDEYSRGSAAPSLVTTPSLLMRGGLETLCADFAELFVDTQATAAFRSSAPDRAIGKLVTRLMGLTADEATVPSAILKDHYDAILQQGAAPGVALKSTFVLACLTPSLAAIGE